MVVKKLILSIISIADNIRIWLKNRKPLIVKPGCGNCGVDGVTMVTMSENLKMCCKCAAAETAKKF